LDEYCHYFLTHSSASCELTIPFQTIKTKNQLDEAVGNLFSCAKPAFKALDTQRYLAKTVSKMFSTGALYCGLKADKTISRMYNETLDRAKKLKSRNASCEEWYDLIFNLCLIRSNAARCREKNNDLVCAICTEIDTCAISTWINKMERSLDKDDKIISIADLAKALVEPNFMNGRISGTQILIFLTSQIARLPALQERFSRLYAIFLLLTTVMRDKEMKEAIGYAW